MASISRSLKKRTSNPAQRPQRAGRLGRMSAVTSAIVLIALGAGCGKIEFMKAAWMRLCSALAFLASATAAEWEVHRFEGRDYVSLDNIAAFYGLPKPPPMPAPPPAPVAPTLPAPPPPPVLDAPAQTDAAAADEPAEATEPIVPAAPEPPRKVTLYSARVQLEVTINSREVMINGAKQWLAFPVVAQDEKILVSRLDLSKVIEPRLRPERIEGVQPFTTVVLDPGHGGHDKGARSKFGFEKDFALDVALRARKLLEARGFKVAMTRTKDIFIPLHERPRLAKGIPDSVFVSIHFNASSTNAEARGFEIFSMAPRGAPATNDGVFHPRDLREDPGNAQELPSSALAGAIYHSLLGHVPNVDRGLKHARFAVLRLCTVPAVLVECGFVTNAPESVQIGTPEWRARVAAAIVEGIDGYKELAVHKQAPKLIADYRRDATSGVQLRSE